MLGFPIGCFPMKNGSGGVVECWSTELQVASFKISRLASIQAGQLTSKYILTPGC